jgi:hypothetical protein
MIWKSNGLFIAAAATLLCATSAFAQENYGTPRAEGCVYVRRFQTLQQLHPRRHDGRELLEAEQIRSQQCVSIGFRTRHRPGGQ